MFWDHTSSKLIIVAQRYRNKCPLELCVTPEPVPAERISPFWINMVECHFLASMRVHAQSLWYRKILTAGIRD